ncbi:DUF3630 family protein [Aliiglaciecola litoralis]|uniref:DUF3630 domain-containing protein n=1 Tax=Aliiglaciecola litoralis TaxID=582857 RepID=A0ABN1LJ80_9ALTE
MFKLINDRQTDSNAFWVQQGEVINFQCDRFPQQQEFIQAANDLATEQGFQITDISEGVDRAQVHFVVTNTRYILCFEGTCEAIWIEAVGRYEAQTLASLLTQLN